MKSSFVLYTEYEDKLKMLTDEQFGQLMRAIFQYEKNGSIQIELDTITQLAFSFISGDLDRANEKYRQSIENGKKGGRPTAKGNSGSPKPKETKNNPDITPDNPPETQANPEEPTANLDVDVDVDVDVDDNVNEDDNDSTPPTPPKGDSGSGKLTKKDFEKIMDESEFGQPLKDALRKWLNYKRERNQPYKKTGFEGIISQARDSIQKYGEPLLIEIINESIASGYQGITWGELQKRSNMRSIQQSAKQSAPAEYHSAEEVLGLD